MCGHRRYEHVRWSGSARTERDSRLRASDAERERVIERLREHAGEGRLDIEELEQRIEGAYAAKTRGDLAALLDDLPQSPPRRRSGARRVVALGSTAAALLPLAIAIAIFSLAPHGLSWLGWPVLGWWLFAGLPATGFGFADCGQPKRRRERTSIV
jgi:Domain of unknown function (DUF1707)